MLRSRNLTTIAKLASAALLAVALVASPALANNGKGGGNGGGNAGGNGGGNAGGNGNGGSHANSHSAASASTGSTGQTQTQTDQDSTQISASSLGGLNGFMHASPSALKHASAKSRIGKVAKVYAGLLQNYLAPEDGTTPPTAEEVAAALAAAANKPLTPEIIQAVNDKLAATNPTLAGEIQGYSGGSAGLASTIHDAL